MENGSYVTRAELHATVSPMQYDITEIKRDVKTLLSNDAGRRAISASAWQFLSLLVVACGVLAAVFIH